MSNRKLLYISMLGESSLYNVEDYKELCPTGLEKDWIRDWYAIAPDVGAPGFCEMVLITETGNEVLSNRNITVA